MATDKRKVQLEVEVDAAGAKAGFGEVKLAGADMAASIAASGAKAGKTVGDIGAGASKSTEQLSRAERSMVQSIERTTAAFSAGSKSSSEYYRVLAQQRGIDPKVLQPYLEALDKVAPKQKQVADAVMATVPAMQKYEMSAKATAAALRQVPAQVTDIVVGLQGGQAPLTVLLQQGGQLRDVFGSTGNAVKALGGFLSTLLTPLNVALAAAAGLGLAFFQGRKEAEAYNRALVLTGNFAGTSVGALQAMASSVSEVTGATKGAAAEALTAFAAAGELGAASFERFGATAIRIQRETGVAVAETVKQFVALGKDPVSASVKLNENTNYLTLSVYRQIKALDDQGRSADAAALAMNTYADSMDSRSLNLAGNLGTLETAWRAVAGAAKSAWDFMLNIGREDSTETKIADITARLKTFAETAALDKRGKGLSAVDETERKRLEADLVELSKRAMRTQDVAAAEAARARDTKKRIQFDQDSAKVAREEVTLAKELAQAKQKYFGDIAKGLITQKEYDTYIANIQAKYAKKGRAPADRTAELEKATARSDEAEIQRAFELQANAYTNGDKILEALRSAGRLDDATYFAAKRASIEDLAALEEKALTDEIDRERRRVIVGKTADDLALAKLDRDKRIADLEQRRDIARANALNGVQLLGLQETEGAERIDRAFAAARASAELYFKATEVGYARIIAAKGRGDAANALEAGRNQILDKYTSDRDAANRDFLSGPDNKQTRERLEEQLRLISEYQAKALKSWEDHYYAIKTSEMDWTTGATRAIENYLDTSANVASQTQKMFTNAFGDMEDALVSFVTTGKLNFSKMANAIISDLVRIQIQQSVTRPLAAAIGDGGLFSGLFGDGLSAFAKIAGGNGRALGGPVSAGQMYEVNERGPELLNVAGKQYLMMGNQDGTVTPNQNAVGGSVVQNLYFTVGDVPTKAYVQQAVRGALGQAAAAQSRAETYR